MKKTIVLMMMIMLGSFSAFADTTPSASDSWTTIQQDVATSLFLSIAQDNYAARFGNEGYFNACVDGANLRSIKPLSVCVSSHWTGRGQSDVQLVCDQYASKNVVQPMQFAETRCADYTYVGGNRGKGICTSYETVMINLSTAPVLTIQQKSTGAQDDVIESDLFTKAYQIPACN